ncbi:hypothetical protein LUZ62_060156 [Rhynchospora pubera]|uniref:Uncharacterized protein n=1 Tax=Rhynchospora pubera TaxID=906938 RepID=A0AAV8E967_9POAL|nr:hypothetical protein LUZ62_060156 [Rhynchospora pubera]
MADVGRRYPYGNRPDSRYEKEHRHDNGIGSEYYQGTYGKGVGYNNRTDYEGRFTNEYRNDYNAVIPYNPSVYRTYELRNQYGGGEPRRLEVVKGNVFSVNQIFVTPPPGMPYRPPLSLPAPKDETKRGSAWCFSDPEMKRKRRVASYKAYSVEGKVKASLKKGIRWIKYKCSELIHGW